MLVCCAERAAAVPSTRMSCSKLRSNVRLKHCQRAADVAVVAIVAIVSLTLIAQQALVGGGLMAALMAAAAVAAAVEGNRKPVGPRACIVRCNISRVILLVLESTFCGHATAAQCVFCLHVSNTSYIVKNEYQTHTHIRVRVVRALHTHARTGSSNFILQTIDLAPPLSLPFYNHPSGGDDVRFLGNFVGSEYVNFVVSVT